MRYRVKLVPHDAPNADGRFIYIHTKEPLDPCLTWQEGADQLFNSTENDEHVVQYERAPE